MQYDVIVVGGGASGLMAAGRAAERGLKVLLLEKNRKVGAKLSISGGGRCNITNAELDERVLLKKYGSAEQFLYSTFAQFGVADTFKFFESHNLPLITEANKRAFPKTQKADDVVRVLEQYVKSGKVTVRLLSPVTKVLTEDKRIVGVVCKDTTYKAAQYIFATGSVSHPETGSTGDGFLWLKKLGHTVKDPTPTIVPLRVREKWVKDLAGIALEDAKITIYCQGQKQFALKGKVLCTHFGLSGPLILNNAQKVADLLEWGMVTATLDAFPEMEIGTLEKKVIATFDMNKNKTLKNVMKDIVPVGFHKGVLSFFEGKMDLSQKVHSVSREDRKHFVHELKALSLSIDGLMGFERAVVADGGVDLREIDFKTMRSKKVRDLFITGDLLNINRPSGGYSLQLCWSTGYVAGNSVREG